MAVKSVPIGQLLVDSGYITDEQLNDALARQKTEFNGEKIGEILLKLGYVSETQVVHALSARLKVPYIDLVTSKIDIEAVKKIPEEIARKNTVIGYKIQGGRLYVATNDPVNFYIFEELKITAGMEIYPMLATRSAIVDAIDRAYSQNTASDIMNDINKEYDANQALMQAELENVDERIDNAPVVKLVNTLVENAYRKTASDIHIEPFKTKTRIRFRIDGELVEQMSVKANVHSALVTRIKILAGMNIAEKRIPLDGRYGVVIDGVTQDLRVSSIPTVYGEKVVIRLLATGDEKARKITDLGMTDYNYEMFSNILR